MAASSLQGVTATERFLSCNSKQTKLFSVNPGVPAGDALETASCFLGDALNALGIEDNPCFAAQRCIEFAKAAIDAVIAGTKETKPAKPAAANETKGGAA